MHMPPLAWLVAVASCPAIWLPGREISTLVDPMASTFNDAVETRAFAALDAPQFAILNGSALSKGVTDKPEAGPSVSTHEG